MSADGGDIKTSTFQLNSALRVSDGKQVIYTTIGNPPENDPLYPVYVQFERFREAQYSRELSEKVWRGCVKIVEQGYWAGGSSPEGTKRLLLDEKRETLHTLAPGQRRGIQHQRVTLMQGDPDQIATIHRIFHEFVSWGTRTTRLPKGSTERGSYQPVANAGGFLCFIRIRHKTYLGTLVYNKTSEKHKTRRIHNATDKWVRTPEAFEGIVSRELFDRAHPPSGKASDEDHGERKS